MNTKETTRTFESRKKYQEVNRSKKNCKTVGRQERATKGLAHRLSLLKTWRLDPPIWSSFRLERTKCSSPSSRSVTLLLFSSSSSLSSCSLSLLLLTRAASSFSTLIWSIWAFLQEEGDENLHSILCSRREPKTFAKVSTNQWICFSYIWMFDFHVLDHTICMFVSYCQLFYGILLLLVSVQTKGEKEEIKHFLWIQEIKQVTNMSLYMGPLKV